MSYQNTIKSDEESTIFHRYQLYLKEYNQERSERKKIDIVFLRDIRTLNPENRTLLRVEYSKGTKEKSKEDQNIIKILMGDEVAPRKDFITEKALEVENLDI